MASATGDRLTSKQNGFATDAATGGMTLSAAYRKNYDVNGDSDATVHVAASQLAAKDKVAMRIRELQDDYSAMADLSPGRIASELTEDRRDAKAAGNHTAAVKATELRGDIIDTFGKRRMTVDSRSVNVTASIDSLSPEELRQLLALGQEAKVLEAGDSGSDAPEDG